MKILYVTTVGITMIFFKNLIKDLIDSGDTVDIMTNNVTMPVPDFYNDLGCKVYNMNSSRSPLNLNNFKAYEQLKKHLDTHKYDIIHCHTPIAAAITRLAAKNTRKKGTKIIYTAHGFHFFKGAPLKNWLLYFPIEWLCSFYTDVLITINTEDYNFAKKILHSKSTKYVPGVGIDIEFYKNFNINHDKKREELGIPKNHTVILSVGELNDNKNHQVIIEALAKTKRKDITYVICGEGNMKVSLEEKAKKYGLDDQVVLLGYRTDVREIYKCCDIFVFPSKREGLPVSLMEAMSAGLPCITTKIRGCQDLIDNEFNGFLCQPRNSEQFAICLDKLSQNEELRKEFINRSYAKLKMFQINTIINTMKEIYTNQLNKR